MIPFPRVFFLFVLIVNSVLSTAEREVPSVYIAVGSCPLPSSPAYHRQCRQALRLHE